MSLLKKTKTPPVKLASIRPEPSSSLDRIRVIAKSIGLNLSDEVLTFLAPQVDYRLKELIQVLLQAYSLKNLTIKFLYTLEFFYLGCQQVYASCKT